MKKQLGFAALGVAVMLGLTLFACSAADAATILSVGGDIRLAGDWDNGMPSSGNPGTIAVDGILGDSDTFGFGAGAEINHTAGTIDALPFTGASRTGFNMNGGGTWNMSGGRILGRYVLANGGSTIFNFSGGTVELADVEGGQHFGAANGGTFNVSGSVVLDGTHATTVVQTGGTVDIATGWTGSWTWGPHTGDDWKNLFTGGDITVDGASIDGATFGSTFLVTNGGQTLAMVPEPGTFALLGLAGLLMLVVRRKR